MKYHTILVLSNAKLFKWFNLTIITFIYLWGDNGGLAHATLTRNNWQIAIQLLMLMLIILAYLLQKCALIVLDDWFASLSDASILLGLWTIGSRIVRICYLKGCVSSSLLGIAVFPDCASCIIAILLQLNCSWRHELISTFCCREVWYHKVVATIGRITSMNGCASLGMLRKRGIEWVSIVTTVLLPILILVLRWL